MQISLISILLSLIGSSVSDQISSRRHVVEQGARHMQAPVRLDAQIRGTWVRQLQVSSVSENVHPSCPPVEVAQSQRKNLNKEGKDQMQVNSKRRASVNRKVQRQAQPGSNLFGFGPNLLNDATPRFMEQTPIASTSRRQRTEPQYRTMSDAMGATKVDPDSGIFLDSYNRQALFRGSNLVQKGPPWYPPQLLDPKYIENLKKWGFNAMRLGMMWSGVEPEQGQFNWTYISIMKKLMTDLGAAGINVLLDMHQDCLSGVFVGPEMYDGVPAWLIKSFPKAVNPFPWPLDRAPDGANWWESYLTLADAQAFQNLYDNQSAAIFYWKRFWKLVASEFKGFPNLLGYELINEPWAGNQFEDPLIIIPGVAGSKNLQRVYDELASAIREVDEEHMIFYEPVTWSVYSSSLTLGNGFDHVPGGVAYRDRSVLSYHYYCAIITPPDSHQPYPHWKRLLCDDALLMDMFPAVLGSRARTGGGTFFTEFGLCTPDSESHSTDTIECATVMRRADDFHQSWTYWDAGFYFDNGSVNPFVVRQFARVYPRAVAGRLTTLSFDIDSALAFIEWRSDAYIAKQKVSEIFVPVAVHYSGGFEVDLWPPTFQYCYKPEEQVLYVWPLNDKAVSENTTVTLIVSKKGRGSEGVGSVPML